MAEEFGRTHVEQLARLARLRLTDEELDRFAGQLTRILAYADAIQQVDTADIPPMSHPVGAADQLREDRASDSLSREDALAAAPEPDHDSGLFTVPRVLG